MTSDNEPYPEPSSNDPRRSEQPHPAVDPPAAATGSSPAGAPDEPLAIPAEARPGLDEQSGRPGVAPDSGLPTAPPPTSPPVGDSWPPPPPTSPPDQWGPPSEQWPVTASSSAPATSSLPPTSTAPGVHARQRPGGWIWPVVCVLALLLGVVGGVGGAALYDELSSDVAADGQTGDGLADVDLGTQPPLDEDGTVASVADAMVPSTVRIVAEFQGQDGGATGSGFVFDKQGHIVTNNHVVADAAENDGSIQIVDQDGTYYDATVVGRSPVYDLALLYAEDATDLPPASIGNSKKLQVGDPVVAIGYPLGLNTTVTSGIVSALGQPVSTGNTADDSSYINAVQTDAAINPGNSGGPLVNRRGQVIGVNSAIATNGGGTVDQAAGNIGVGFAIPSEQVLVTADQILKSGEAQYPVIGAKVQTGGVQTESGGQLVEIVDGSPSQDAGLRKDDLITHVNGEPVSDGLHLIVVIRSYQPGDTVEFTVKRGNQTQQVDVTLDGEVG